MGTTSSVLNQIFLEEETPNISNRASFHDEMQMLDQRWFRGDNKLYSYRSSNSFKNPVSLIKQASSGIKHSGSLKDLTLIK